MNKESITMNERNRNRYLEKDLEKDLEKKSSDKEMNHRVHLLEQRVDYLESLIKEISQNQGQSISTHAQYHDFDNIISNIVITDFHLSQILQSSMEEQIILIIIEINKKTPFMKMTKELCMYKCGWVHMDDSDLKLLIETIEHKILLLHSKSPRDVETHFDNNKIIYGLNLIGRFKKIKNKLIDNI
jgi:small-conductance mechanosensitive channel